MGRYIMYVATGAVVNFRYLAYYNICKFRRIVLTEKYCN